MYYAAIGNHEKSFLILLTTFSVSFSLGFQRVFSLTTSYGFYPNVLSYLYGHIISSTSFSSSFSPSHFYWEKKKLPLYFVIFWSTWALHATDSILWMPINVSLPYYALKV